jgi:hypothetical protein
MAAGTDEPTRGRNPNPVSTSVDRFDVVDADLRGVAWS